MNYFLYGADTYRSRQKLRQIMEAAREKSGAFADVHRLDASEHDVSLLRGIISTPSLFVRKKLVVCERAISAGAPLEKIIPLFEQTKGSSREIIILWDEGLDTAEHKKRRASAEQCMDKTQEFALLAGSALTRWIREEAERRGASLSPDEGAILSSTSGGDLWRAANLIEKHALGAGVRSLEHASGSVTTIFDLGDRFLGDPRPALSLLHALIRQGHEARDIFFYLAGHARSLLVMKLYGERGEPVPGSAGIHPYVVKKTASLVRTLDRVRLTRAVEQFFYEDAAIKTGASSYYDSLLRVLLG